MSSAERPECRCQQITDWIGDHSPSDAARGATRFTDVNKS